MEIKEIWKTIENYPDYQVSNLGRIKSLKFGRERVLKQAKNTQGYYFVILYQNKKQKIYRVHKLVALHFIPNPQNLPQIDHIDTNRQNNYVSNLRWVTNKENCNNPITKIKYSKANKGKNKGRVLSQETKDKMSIAHKGNPNLALSKPILQLSKSGNIILRKWDSAHQVKRELNIIQSNVCKCCNNKRKSCGGFKWMYLQDYIDRMEKLYQLTLKKAS